jgi:aminopeptidase N
MKGGTYKSFYLPESSPHYPPQRDFRTSHVRIELDLDFERQAAQGACTLTVEPIRPELRQIRLDATQLNIRKVTVDGKPTDFEYDNLHLLVPIMPGEGQRSIMVDYSFAQHNGVHFVGPDKEYPDKELQAWTHGEADNSRYWFPCHDRPDEKSTSETVITVPKGMRVISNGKLLSTTENGPKVTFHWREDTPHSMYLTSFVAGKFSVVEQEANGVRLSYNFPEKKRADILRYFGETPKMIEVFEELTGVKYPYEKYDQTTVEEFHFGGMENLNATTLAMNYYPDAASEEDFQTTYASPFLNPVSLVAHELSHQWFGDLVTCADWPHAWLNEGFATYFQALYLERTRGVDTMRWDMEARAENYFEEDGTHHRRPVVDRNYVWIDDVFDYTTYDKGASMLHLLRYYMGDAAFFGGVTEYLKSHSFSVADSHDFLKVMEKTSGLALEELFEQSFFKPGYPEFEIEYSFDDSNSTATLHVRQVQSLDGGTPVFKLPCEFVFYVKNEPKTYRVWIDSADQTLSFPLAERPTIVEFDPKRWLLKKIRFEKSLDLLLAQLQGSVEAWSRAEAARDLGKMKSDGAIPGLKNAATKEQFWDVRACALLAIGEIGTKDALKALLEVGIPKNRRVRRAMAAALGNFKDESARGVILSLLKTDESPYVRCEAALSLAKCWPEGALPHLRDAMLVHSPNETLAEACLDAMGKIKNEEVNGIVKECIPYGKPTRVRIGALKAIKGRGKIADDEVSVLRDILLHDKEFRVRVYLVDYVIRPLGDMRFLEVLKEASSEDPDHRVKRSALETYHEFLAGAEHSGTISKLRDEVEELKEENRRLAAKLA